MCNTHYCTRTNIIISQVTLSVRIFSFTFKSTLNKLLLLLPGKQNNRTTTIGISW